MTLSLGLVVTQGRWKRHRSIYIAWYDFIFTFYSNFGAI